jgi:hypothetical protein
VHSAVGEIRVLRSGPSFSFDFGEWASEVASKLNPGGTSSLRDAQHEYVLVES